MKKQFFQIIPVFIIGLIFVFGDAVVLCAQEAASDEFTLEEITVTAQKRAENQQKVPITMETISGSELALEGRNNVDDILRNLSNVTINTMQDGMRVSIRGLVDNEDLAMGTGFKVSGSMVGVNIDGAQNSMSSAGQNLFDLERVEVLYGPQSTLYGSNSPGGILNVVTAAPKTDNYSASIGANYGSYNYLNLQAALNVPVIQDKMALRLAVSRSKQDPFVEGATGTDNTSVRLKALWQPNETLSITLTPSWSKNANGGMMSGSVKPFRNQDGDYQDGAKVTDPWTKSDTAGADSGGDQTTKGLSANVDWNTAIGNFALVPSYSKSSSESTSTDMEGYVFDGTQSSTQKQAELRVTNPESFTLFTWIIGGTYNIFNQEMIRDFRDPNAADSSFYARAEKKAIYANVTYPLPFYDKMALTAGYRQSWDKNDSKSQGMLMPGETGTPAPKVQTGKFSKPDIKVGFDWNATDNMMVYGSFANSYRSVNAQAAPGMEDTPEKLAAYTLGEKARFFNNKLQINGSIYYYDYKNKAERTEDKYTYVSEEYLGYDYDEDGDIETEETVYISTHGNQLYGTFKSLGQDVSATWIITDQDRLSFSVSHLAAEWSDLVSPASEDYPDLWPEVSYEGSITANSPKWSMTASYEHNFILGDLGMLTPVIDAQYKAAHDLNFDPGNEDNTGLGYQEAYILWNGSATFNSASGRWSLNASVKNIFNYAVKRSYVAQQENVVLFLNEPRTYQIGFNIKF